MRSNTVISILVALVLGATSMSSFAQQGQGGAGAGHAPQMDRDRTFDRDQMSDRDRTFDRDRTRDRDRSDDPDQDRDRDRLQDPANLKDQDIYGNKLMSESERSQYRNELGNTKTQEARMKFQAQHEQKMRERALEKGKDLVPPGQGPVYGGELMSVQERNEYREQLRLMDSDQEREQFQAQHRDRVEQRAKALGREVEDAE